MRTNKVVNCNLPTRSRPEEVARRRATRLGWRVKRAALEAAEKSFMALSDADCRLIHLSNRRDDDLDLSCTSAHKCHLRRPFCRSFSHCMIRT